MLLKAGAIFMLAKLVFSRYLVVGPAQVRIVSVTSCSNYSNLPLQMEIKPYMFNETVQLVNVSLNAPMGIDDNMTVSLRASRVDKKKTQMNSFVLNDAEACSTLTKYIGDLWLDLETQIGIEPGVCPIKMGNYSLHNFLVDLTKMKIQMFLEGEFQTSLMVKNGTKPLYCADFNIILSAKN